jgi:sulfoxide reductase heme-binding subunit YedZ
MPWTDHAGKFSPLKAACFAFVLYPALWLLLRWAGGDLGPRPWVEAIHRSGDWAVRFLVLALAVTPARAAFGWARVVLLRRMLGVAAAGYALLHLLLYVADQKWNLWVVGSEIVLRFYLTVGFVVLVGLSVLAWTSTDAWQKRLRLRWKALHRLAYPLTGLALFHYALQAKINASEAMVWFGLFAWMMLCRAWPRARQAVLVPVAVGLTAASEIAWYGVATKVPAWRVMEANLRFDPWVRPAQQVVLVGLVVLAVMVVRRRSLRV